MEKSELKEFDLEDQKLINEFLKSEGWTLEDIEDIEESDIYDVPCLEINNGYWIIIQDDSKMDENCLNEIQDARSEYPYFYTEGIKSGDIDPVYTSFKDWTEQIIQYDGWISIVGSYDGDYTELSGNAVYFRRN